MGSCCPGHWCDTCEENYYDLDTKCSFCVERLIKAAQYVIDLQKRHDVSPDEAARAIDQLRRAVFGL
jgi:hypothetical protein